MKRECDSCLKVKHDVQWCGGEEGGYPCPACRSSLKRVLDAVHQRVMERPWHLRPARYRAPLDTGGESDG